ncbi:MAG: hypothetical protein LBC76_00110 [Treponema sp.]|jgi:hypothetical protein|nr:hypothetical protein [Treponema sp.]
MKNTITVQGRAITYEIKDVDINEVQYYPENPRINYIISSYPKNEITQDLIQNELLKLDQTRERIKDLEENKGLIDEIYILNKKVIEGNTRLCAFRILSKKYPNDKRWETIKARILQDNVSEEELFYILGIFHIKGKTEWNAYEKAAYIYKMIVTLKKSPDDIGKQLRMQPKNIVAALKSYKAMKDKYLTKNKDKSIDKQYEDLRKFSYFDAFYHQKELVEREENTPEFLNNFVAWVKEDRFKNAQSVRDLPKILNNKRAQKIFCVNEPETAYFEAMQILHQDKPGKVDKFYKKFEEFSDFLDGAEINKIKEEIIENRNKKHVIETCYKKLKRFTKDCGLEV